jgi:hypothetical protein
MAKYDIQLQHAKCAILGRAASKIVDPHFKVISEDTMPPEEAGLTIMGVPTGTMAYRKKKAFADATKKARALRAVHKLKPETAFLVLRKCINTRLIYLSRVLDPVIAGSALRWFDTQVDIAVGEILKVGSQEAMVSEMNTNTNSASPTIQRIRCIRSLPFALSGLSINRLGGVSNESQSLRSRAITNNFMTQYMPHILTGTSQWEDVTIGADVRGYPELDGFRNQDQRQENSDGAFARNIEGSDGLESQVSMHHVKVWQAQYKDLIDMSEMARAAWFLSNKFIGSGRWLDGKGSIRLGKFGITSDNFLEALRMRCLVHPMPAVDTFPRRCDCGGHQFSNMEFTHFLNCPTSSWYFIKRHNCIVDLLAELIKKCRPGVVDVEVEGVRVPMRPVEGERSRREDRRAPVVDESGRVVADIRYTEEGQSTIIDVAVADPAAPSYRALPIGSAATPDVAALFRENEKRTKYAGIDNVDVIPFALEATGRLGPAALAYITKLCGNEAVGVARRNRFIDRASVVCANYSSMCMIQRRRRIIGDIGASQ